MLCKWRLKDKTLYRLHPSKCAFIVRLSDKELPVDDIRSGEARIRQRLVN